MEIGKGCWSPALERLAVWLSGQLSFKQASQVLVDVGQMHVSPSSVWRQAQNWGTRLLEQEVKESQQANAMPSRDIPQAGEPRYDQRMGVSVDGWMVHIRGEGWKEVKTGSLFEVHREETADAQSGEAAEQAVASQSSYVAHLGGPATFGEKLWAEAVRRQVPAAYDKVWVGDAAPWIWNLCQDYCPEAEQVVDWFHALSHLHTAANLLHGEGSDKAQRWTEQMKILLYQGHARRIAHLLDEATIELSDTQADQLRAEATFFRNNHRRMRYLEFREDGWPIGSGMIESGCKQFHTRMKGPGM